MFYCKFILLFVLLIVKGEEDKKEFRMFHNLYNFLEDDSSDINNGQASPMASLPPIVPQTRPKIKSKPRIVTKPNLQLFNPSLVRRRYNRPKVRRNILNGRGFTSKNKERTVIIKKPNGEPKYLGSLIRVVPVDPNFHHLTHDPNFPIVDYALDMMNFESQKILKDEVKKGNFSKTKNNVHKKLISQEAPKPSPLITSTEKVEETVISEMNKSKEINKISLNKNKTTNQNKNTSNETAHKNKKIIMKPNLEKLEPMLKPHPPFLGYNNQRKEFEKINKKFPKIHLKKIKIVPKSSLSKVKYPSPTIDPDAPIFSYNSGYKTVFVEPHLKHREKFHGHEDRHHNLMKKVGTGDKINSNEKTISNENCETVHENGAYMEICNGSLKKVVLNIHK